MADEKPIFCEICRDIHVEGKHLSLDEVDRRHILHVYKATGYRKRRTAEILKINYSTFKRRMYRYS